MKSAALLLLLTASTLSVVAQTDSLCVADATRNDCRVATVPKAKWFTGVVAFAELNAINGGIRLWDRYVLDRDWAHVSWSYVKENLKMNLEWDHDFFATNMAAHPYHGSIYYNCGRSLGMSPLGASAEAALGSLMWEIYGETDRPSTSDIFTTTFGGIIIGEMTHRISDEVIDESSRGLERVWRETVATIVNPARGLNRIVSGRAWKIRSRQEATTNRQHQMETNIGTGWVNGGYSSAYVKVGVDYGSAFNEEEQGFFDHFRGDVTATFFSRASVIHDMRLYGQLLDFYRKEKGRTTTATGLYQSFNFYDSDSPLGLNFSGPYRVAETAAGGPAFSLRTTTKRGNVFNQHLMLSAIAMGAVKSDYYISAHRDYNFSSGWSFKSMSSAKFGNRIMTRLSADFFRFYSWKGYEKELKNNPDADLFYINTQGDVSNASVAVVCQECSVRLFNGLNLDLCGSWFWRHTHYKYYEDVTRGNGEIRLGLSYSLK